MGSTVDAPEEKYFMQHNSAEVERLSCQHEVIQSFMGGKLVLAPLDLTQPGLKILDSATADGLWLRSLRISLRTPSLLLGTDITPSYFPATSPPPISLTLQSITQPWPAHLRSTFDLVHQRFALPAAGLAQIRDALRSLIALVKPGGWLQLGEADHSVFTGPAMGELFEVVKEVFGAMDVGYKHGRELKRWLLEEGLCHVEEMIVDVPLGKRNPDAEKGRMSQEAFTLGAKGLVEAARQVKAKVGEGILEGLVERVEKELKEEGGVNRVYFAWGQVI